MRMVEMPKETTKIREQRELLSDLVDTISEINRCCALLSVTKEVGSRPLRKNGSAMSCARMKNDPPCGQVGERYAQDVVRKYVGCRREQRLARRTCAAINSLTDESSRLARCSPRNMTLPQRGVCWVRKVSTACFAAVWYSGSFQCSMSVA